MKQSAIMHGFSRADTRDVAPPAGTRDRKSSSPSAAALGERWAVIRAKQMQAEIEREYRDLARDYESAQERYAEIRAKQMQAEIAEELELPALSHQGRFEKLKTPSGSSADEAYEMLRTQILLLMQRGGYRTLAVTSPTPGAGTSTVAANVAVALSREFDFTTILVDANLRHPSLRRMLDLSPGPGLVDFLAGTAEPEEVLVQMEGRRLLILPGGEPLDSGAELLRSAMMVELVRGLRDAPRDRLVVFDLPPVLDCPDMLAFSPYVDAVLLVIEEGVTTQEELERAHEILAEANVLGIVPCKSREAARLRRGRARKKAGSGRRAHEIRTLEARFNEISPPAEETPAGDGPHDELPS